MSTSKDISGHKMCPLGVKLISSIRKFHFSSSDGVEGEERGLRKGAERG